MTEILEPMGEFMTANDSVKEHLIGSASLRCDCLCSTVVVDKVKFGEEKPWYNISFQDSCANWGCNTLRFRIKAAWKMLTKKPVSYADIYIEDESVFARFVGELVEMVGMRQIAKADKKCHMCFDCPDGCPIENPNDPKNDTEEQ